MYKYPTDKLRLTFFNLFWCTPLFCTRVLWNNTLLFSPLPSPNFHHYHPSLRHRTHKAPTLLEPKKLASHCNGMKHFEDLLTFTDPVFLAHLNIVTIFKRVVMLGCFFFLTILLLTWNCVKLIFQNNRTCPVCREEVLESWSHFIY